MRTLRWIALTAAVGLVAIGCNGTLSDNGETGTTPPDTTPSPITSISAPVVGFTGSADVQFEARDPNHDVLLASGTLVAAASRFDAEFLPLADVPSIVLGTEPPEFGIEEGDLVCDVSVVPETLRTTGAFMFSQVDGFSMLALATFDFFAGSGATTFPVGSRIYVFLLADRAGRIQGTCNEPDLGVTIEYAVDLVEGWNSVAFALTSVDTDGDPVSWRIQDEQPTPQAQWSYFGIDIDIPD